MRRTGLIALFAMVAVPAVGQRQVTPPPGLEDPVSPPSGGVSVSQQGRILIAADLCATLLRPEAAVPGADYRPGVDVNGGAVAPADLPGGAPPPHLDNLPIEVSNATQKRYGIPANSPFLRGKAVAGLVTLRDGRTYFNGEPIGDDERAMMLAACREAKR